MTVVLELLEQTVLVAAVLEQLVDKHPMLISVVTVVQVQHLQYQAHP